MSGSRLLGLHIIIALIYAGQYFGDGAMALSRGGGVPHILPTSFWFVIGYFIVSIILEFIFMKYESKGGYVE